MTIVSFSKIEKLKKKKENKEEEDQENKRISNQIIVFEKPLYFPNF